MVIFIPIRGELYATQQGMLILSTSYAWKKKWKGIEKDATIS